MRRRLDAELLRRGMVVSRVEAQAAIAAGLVTVAGRPARKAATLVSEAEPLHLAGPGRRFVSRGGEKLAFALKRFEVDPAGQACFDAGASTGGFTDCLLQAGATAVVAVDVGYGQIDWRIRNDERVTVLERTNVRDLTAGDLPFRPDLVVADLSFISLTLVLSALAGVAGAAAHFILLVKPQFEAGREEVGRGGVVDRPEVWRRVLEEVADACRSVGIVPAAVAASPLLGPAGNVEFLLAGHAGEALATAPDIAAVVAEGRARKEAG